MKYLFEKVAIINIKFGNMPTQNCGDWDIETMWIFRSPPLHQVLGMGSQGICSEEGLHSPSSVECWASQRDGWSPLTPGSQCVWKAGGQAFKPLEWPAGANHQESSQGEGRTSPFADNHPQPASLSFIDMLESMSSLLSSFTEESWLQTHCSQMFVYITFKYLF